MIFYLSQLNKKVQENLFNVNDFIILDKNNLFNYIFLCELSFDENIFNEININKKINAFANDIENEFIKKYTEIFSLEIFNE